MSPNARRKAFDGSVLMHRVILGISPTVNKVDASWNLSIGSIATRAELAARFGGSPYSGGIVTTLSTDNLFLFSDPAEGSKYGYSYDGPSADGLSFFYTGAGTTGDHKLSGPNGNVIDHEHAGRALRLFVADGTIPGRNTKLQRYIGEFRVDPGEPYRWVPTADRENRTRMALVFKLRPVGDTLLFRMIDEGLITPDPKNELNSILVPREVDSTFFYETPSRLKGESRKIESTLVAAFATWLPEGNERLLRWAIRVPGDTAQLLTDVYDVREKILYEAKASADRSNVRHAIGQLLDYRRHIHVPELKCAVLLPQRPNDDLCELILGAGFGIAYKANESFVTQWPE